MAKFSDVIKGKLARKQCEISSIKDVEGNPIKVDLVVLSGTEEADVNEYARQFSISKRGTGLDGDPNYELAHMAKTLALSVVDADVLDKQELFFKNEQAVLDARELGREGIVFMYEQQKSWQREISPGLDATDPQKFLGVALEVAKIGDPGPFLRLKLSSQLSYTVFTSKLLSDLLIYKSQSSLDSETIGEDTKPSIGSDAP